MKRFRFRRSPTQRQPKPRRIIFLRKRYLAIPGALLAICALCLVINIPTYVTASTTDRQLPIYCVQRDYKVCSLTFDAAWGNAILRHIQNGPVRGKTEKVQKKQCTESEGQDMPLVQCAVFSF